MIRPERLYKNIEKLVGMDLREFLKNGCYVKLEAGEGFMPLTIEAIMYEKLETEEMGILAMTHWWEHPSGDLMRDPDMEILIYLNRKVALPMRIRQDPYGESVAIYIENGKVHMNRAEELNEERFLDMWLRNIKNQGYEKTRVVCE